MDNTTFIGATAAVFTTISFLPQVFRVVKTRHTKDLSLWMYFILTTGVFLWLVYGILLHNPPIIIANGITFIFTLAILFYIIKDRLKEK